MKKERKIELSKMVKVGDFLIIDSERELHPCGHRLCEGTDYCDSGFPGCQFRVSFDNGFLKIAANIVVTGERKSSGWYQGFHRCRIEWVGDCEPSTFCGGWIRMKDCG